MYLSSEYNQEPDIKRKREQLALDDNDFDDAGTVEENKIIMEMYNKDNRDKKLKNSKVKTALTKNPPVPRAKELSVATEKPRHLPLLKDFKKHEKSLPKIEAVSELKERIQKHKLFLRELKRTVSVYKNESEMMDKFDIEKRLETFMAEKGILKRQHYRTGNRKVI